MLKERAKKAKELGFQLVEIKARRGSFWRVRNAAARRYEGQKLRPSGRAMLKERAKKAKELGFQLVEIKAVA
jgi:hypothetical protein